MGRCLGDSPQVIIRFGVLLDAAHQTCEPLAELKSLIRAGRLPRTVALYGQLGGGDCSAIARAFLDDLAAIEAHHPWTIVQGTCARIGRHTWIEADGWAFDLSHGDRRAAIVMRAEAYRAMRELNPPGGRV